jgi:hypothetical protein
MVFSTIGAIMVKKTQAKWIQMDGWWDMNYDVTMFLFNI